MEYLIREFRDDDIHALISLCARHAAFEQSEYDSSHKETQLRQALLSDKPSLYCWIVVVNNSPVGYATFTFDFSTWHGGYFLHLDCLYLDENFRDVGIGKVIMNKIINLAKKKNCVNVQWQTPSFNEKAIRFYSRLNCNVMDKKRFVLPLQC